jgi:hypothetical protein
MSDHIVPEEEVTPPEIDPEGEAVPVKRNGVPVVERCARTALVTLGVIVGGTILYNAACPRPTMGATRSAQLAWEDRRQGMEAQIAAELEASSDTGIVEQPIRD